jgi:hypothetical protein
MPAAGAEHRSGAGTGGPGLDLAEPLRDASAMSASTSPGPKPARSRADTFQLSALGFALLASLLLLVVPVFSSATTSTNSAGVEVSRTSTSTLLEAQGSSVLVLLVVPIVLTLLPYLLRSPTRGRAQLTIACTVLLGFGALLALASIGLFYLPALVCSVAASTAALRDPNRLDRVGQ